MNEQTNKILVSNFGFWLQGNVKYMVTVEFKAKASASTHTKKYDDQKTLRLNSTKLVMPITPATAFVFCNYIGSDLLT